MRRSVLVFVLLLSAASAQVVAAGPVDWKSLDVLDLQTAKEMALADNPTLEAAAHRVTQARERVKQSWAAYAPWLDLSGSVAQVDTGDNEHDANLAQARFFNPMAKIADPEDYNSAKLTATWRIFDGFEREFNRKMAAHGRRAVEQSQSDARRLICASVAGSYYSALAAREDVAVAEADAAFNQKLMKEAQVRYDLGAGSLSDVLNFQIGVHSATSQLLVGKQAYQAAMIGLAAILGIEDGDFASRVVLAALGEESAQDMTPPNDSALAENACKSRPDLLQARAFVEQSEAAIGAARAKFFPTLALSAALDASRANDAGFEHEDVEQTVAASLSYNLFAGGLHRAKLAEARAAKWEARASLRQAELTVSQEVRNAATRVRFAQEQVALQRQTAQLVSQNRDLVEKEYKAGQTSLVRLNEAQRDLIRVQSSLARARVLLRQAWHELNTSTGAVL